MAKNAYTKAGVDVEAGYQVVERIKKHAAKTKRLGAMGVLGGFGGMFDLSALKMKAPVLISGTDGVGTKLLLAIEANKHDTIGIDCVAMCVNDCLAQGAKPLFFLDYIAAGKIDPFKMEQIVAGVASGCLQAGCALIGGETAEMPDMYAANEYDLAGFAVGAVEKEQLIQPGAVKNGDILIGLASSGIHSNGYSLVRKIYFKEHHFKLTDELPELAAPLGDVLLEPTKIYVKPVLQLLEKVNVHGISHITGGGFIENLPRMLSKEQSAEIKMRAWPELPIFRSLKMHGNLLVKEMFAVFNMGIGLVIALSENQADQALAILHASGEKAYKIGRVTERQSEQVIFYEEDWM